MRLAGVLGALALAGAAAAAAQEPAVHLYAAGSLRAVMTDIAQAFVANSGSPVKTTFGASGLLRERIEKGERADVFASADLGHPRALAKAGRANEPVVFAHNRLCALVAPGVQVNPDTLLARMLDQDIKLGTSTPKADPSGDYAWQLFEKADRLHPGAYRTLNAKALQLTGGPNSPPPQPARSIYGQMIAEHKADIFLTYCTNVIQAVREVPGAQNVAVPDALAVGADYDLTTISKAPAAALRLADFIMSEEGQKHLVRHGFTPAVVP